MVNICRYYKGLINIRKEEELFRVFQKKQWIKFSKKIIILTFSKKNLSSDLYKLWRSFPREIPENTSTEISSCPSHSGMNIIGVGPSGEELAPFIFSLI